MIGIDITTTQNQYKNRGIGIFTKNVITSWLSSEYAKEIVLLGFDGDSTIHPIPPEQQVHIGQRKNATPTTKGEYIAMMRKAVVGYNKSHEEKITKFFSPFIHSGVTYLNGIDVYVFVHDMIQKYTGIYSSKSFVHNLIKKSQYNADWRALRKAKKIITNSQSSKKDIEAMTGAKDVHVVPLGVDHELYNAQYQKSQRIPYPYLLYYGGDEANKNIIFLLDLFVAYTKTFPKKDITLYIVGKGFEEAKEYVSRKKIERRVKFLGFVNDSQKIHLLVNAVAYINVSLVEGFGLSVLESLSCGTPAIVSNISIYREMFSECCSFIVLDKSHDVVEKNVKVLRSVISSRKKQQIMSENGIRIASGYRWDATFLNIASLIHHD